MTFAIDYDQKKKEHVFVTTYIKRLKNTAHFEVQSWKEILEIALKMCNKWKRP